MINKFNVYENGELCMLNISASEITKRIGIRCNKVALYCDSEMHYQKKYTFKRTELDGATKNDLELAFSKEWDKARFRINKNAKRSSQYDF